MRHIENHFGRSRPIPLEKAAAFEGPLPPDLRKAIAAIRRRRDLGPRSFKVRILSAGPGHELDECRELFERDPHLPFEVRDADKWDFLHFKVEPIEGAKVLALNMPDAFPWLCLFLPLGCGNDLFDTLISVRRALGLPRSSRLAGAKVFQSICKAVETAIYAHEDALLAWQAVHCAAEGRYRANAAA